MKNLATKVSLSVAAYALMTTVAMAGALPDPTRVAEPGVFGLMAAAVIAVVLGHKIFRK